MQPVAMDGDPAAGRTIPTSDHGDARPHARAPPPPTQRPVWLAPTGLVAGGIEPVVPQAPAL